MRSLTIRARLLMLVLGLMGLLMLAVYANLSRQHQSALEIRALYARQAEGGRPISADEARQRSLAVAEDYQAALWRNVSITVVALGLAGGFALRLVRSITQPLRQAVRLAEAVAAGDLAAQAPPQGRDELAQLLRALEQMSAGLAGIVGQVRTASSVIARGSVEIAGGNADLSQRTEAQASNLQQTAASMEQLGATVRHNADTARQAASVAGRAAAVAEEGGAAVQRFVQTMDRIAAASRRITDIIGVIDGIAFQTNILALNAAVEAARAGEQGRGFAVVAGEVRTLAQRAGGAAREIKALIGESNSTVEGGLAHAGAAGETIAQLVGEARQVSELISAISGSSAEQSKGLAQIGEAVNQLDRVTQQNAALVEQSAAAAEALRDQAARLDEVVSVFRLG